MDFTKAYLMYYFNKENRSSKICKTQRMRHKPTYSHIKPALSLAAIPSTFTSNMSGSMLLKIKL